ncbi:transcription initiation factor TFIID subunit 12-like isoform X1 [Drosophila sulfurigaster albostrigata]|uniref:transcription initiation factor TFIID subunit 12 isoform X1 n=1 Tax=Drosophila sulfurigaster albostrigata TaxID=89887 RepID=UPI002D2195B9|nr:transcription initiation factor TFIID subunit 12 isoform X1 [Drosophila sulfurigaster albostrigata]XP_062141843.1 transcription initiation factor TFIID subunit 12-like isoform X1 [Drosophila sulfurigaster albostrigata]
MYYSSLGRYSCHYDAFHNTQTNKSGHNDSPPMASPSQHSPMTNNSNSTSQNGTSATTTTTSQAAAGVGGAGGGGASGKSTNHSPATGAENTPMLTKPRLTELVREVDTTTQLDEDVEELLLQIIDDFVEDTVKSTSAFAKHRKSNKIEVRDVQLHFERKYNMWIPGFGTDELRPYKRAAVTEAHKQRLALIRKTIKKY